MGIQNFSILHMGPVQPTLVVTSFAAWHQCFYIFTQYFRYELDTAQSQSLCRVKLILFDILFS